MENPVLVQLTRLLASIAWGLVVGIFYELCALFRFMGGMKRNAAADLVFWVTVIPSTFLFLLLLNGGDPRGYILISMCTGALAVKLVLGSAVAKFLGPVKRKLYKKRLEKSAKKKSVCSTDEKKAKI